MVTYTDSCLVPHQTVIMMSRNSSPHQATTNAPCSSPLQLQPTTSDSDEPFYSLLFFALKHHAISPIYHFLDRWCGHALPLSPNVCPTAQDDGSYPVNEDDYSSLEDDSSPAPHDVCSNNLDFAGWITVANVYCRNMIKWSILSLLCATLEKPTSCLRGLVLIAVSSSCTRLSHIKSFAITLWPCNIIIYSWKGHRVTCLLRTSFLHTFDSWSGKTVKLQHLSMQCSKTIHNFCLILYWVYFTLHNMLTRMFRTTAAFTKSLPDWCWSGIVVTHRELYIEVGVMCYH